MFTGECYRYLQVCSAFLVCLSHGSNDVANAISPLLVIMRLSGEREIWSFLTGSIGIALGLLLMGHKVMKTIGNDIILLDFMKGYCCEFTTAICICAKSTIGMPVSTTHIAVGSLAGAYLSTKLAGVRNVYKYEKEDAADKNESDSANAVKDSEVAESG